MSRSGPVLPLVGGDTRFQPVYVEDVAAAAVTGVAQGRTGVYELGGPDVDTLRGHLKVMLGVIERRRLIVNLPFWVGSTIALVLGAGSALTLGLVRNSILTSDQVRGLKVDSVVSKGAKTLTDLGIAPTGYAAVIPEYLWRYRPSGQYAAIKASAKNLKRV